MTNDFISLMLGIYQWAFLDILFGCVAGVFLQFLLPISDKGRGRKYQ